jgi:hypothetical protein
MSSPNQAALDEPSIRFKYEPGHLEGGDLLNLDIPSTERSSGAVFAALQVSGPTDPDDIIVAANVSSRVKLACGPT